MIQPHELIVGAVGLLLTVVVRVITVNRLIRSKLRLAIFSFVAYLAVGGLALAGFLPAATAEQFLSIGHLLLALGLVTLGVVATVNPWRADRTPEQFPNIVQDTIIIGIFLVVGTGVMQEKFLTTSAVGAVVIGFALQDTLGNTFAGLAIQVEKPFRADQWVRIGSYEGRVVAITWRATRLVTKTGDAVIVPNNVVSKEAITNFSEPTSATRLFIEVGASYSTPPNEVKAAIAVSLADAPLVLAEPAPEVMVADFGASSITYRVRFWVADYGQDDLARDQVRTCIYYALSRKGIEIPFPIRVNYHRTEAGSAVSLEERRGFIDAVDMFAPLSAEDRERLAGVARERLFGAGQTVVRQHDPGDSMFVIGRGTVRITIEPGHAEVTRLRAGAYVGEMSLLTGQPRTATVSAVEDSLLLEIGAADFRQIALTQPAVFEQVTRAVADRQAALDRSREAMASMTTAPEVPRSFLLRVREFLKL
jgi:small-conductance mechanosensitive channel/CRP-like cAMP-binding protein